MNKIKLLICVLNTFSALTAFASPLPFYPLTGECVAGLQVQSKNLRNIASYRSGSIQILVTGDNPSPGVPAFLFQSIQFIKDPENSVSNLQAKFTSDWSLSVDSRQSNATRPFGLLQISLEQQKTPLSGFSNCISMSGLSRAPIACMSQYRDRAGNLLTTSLNCSFK